MIFCNKSGFSFATKVTSRRPPRPEMMLVVKAVYALVPGQPLTLLDRELSVPRGDVLGEDDAERALEVSYASDFADAKLNAEILFRGCFHAPGKRPVKESEIAISVGRWSKRLRVVGPRAWADDALGSQASEPLAMTTVPISWAYAYGGPGFAPNPDGRGHVSSELPQIEQPGAPVRSRGAHNVAQSLGPINPSWPERAQKVGTRYGSDWQERRAPFVSEDFDWTYHHAAPADQQLEGYLRGDETIAFENLHPDASSFSQQLPGVRVRAFARMTSGDFRAMRMELDTLFADLDKGQLTLSWRGHLAVRELDLVDVKSLLIAREDLGAALMEREYEAMLDAFEEDPAGVEAARAEALAEMEADIVAAPGEVPSGPPDAVSRVLAEKLEGFAAIKRNIAIGMAAARTNAPDRDAGAELAKAVEAASAAGDDQPPVPISPKPGAMPSMGARRIVRNMMVEVDRARAEIERAERAGRAVPREKVAEIRSLANLPLDPKWPALDPEYSVPEPLSKDEPGPGANLVDHDLTGRDLSGLDLRGARLDGAVLTRAKLVGTKLTGASLRGAVLFRTEARGADFSGADLTRANCARLSAPEADFSGANLELAFFEDADLTAARLEGTRAEWAALARADLSRVRARGLRFFRCDMEAARLVGAVMSHGSIRACVLSRCEGEGIDLEETEIRAVSAQEAKLGRAKLVRAHGERVNLTEADLDGADLSLADLPRSHFISARMRDAEVWGADLRGARMTRADLSGARFDRANLIGADLCHTKLTRSRFGKASLYDAKLLEAAGEDADFSGANLEKSVYTKRKVFEAER